MGIKFQIEDEEKHQSPVQVRLEVDDDDDCLIRIENVTVGWFRSKDGTFRRPVLTTSDGHLLENCGIAFENGKIKLAN